MVRGRSIPFWKNSNVTEEDMLNAVSATHVIPVLTAHPTEAKRVTVIELHRELYLLLVKKENTSLSKLEQNEIKEKNSASRKMVENRQKFTSKTQILKTKEQMFYIILPRFSRMFW